MSLPHPGGVSSLGVKRSLKFQAPLSNVHLPLETARLFHALLVESPGAVGRGQGASARGSPEGLDAPSHSNWAPPPPIGVPGPPGLSRGFFFNGPFCKYY